MVDDVYPPGVCIVGGMERHYNVEGMTCEHCVLSVRDELSGVAGVEHVDLDLASGRLILTGQGFDDDDVRDAVDTAGYALARSRPSAA